QVIMMMPLLEGLSGGAKMSKSYNNYVGIEEEPSEMLYDFDIFAPPESPSSSGIIMIT
ncbi:hypothetical protein KAX21_06250, partial [candidate division WOR-3 bacterium]|nr:hypothetical protein [candidate division WOR-3 bacterium]